MHENMSTILTNVNEYIRKILLSYTLSNQFPSDWNADDFGHYLKENHLSLFLTIFAFEDMQISHISRLELERLILQQFDLSSKAYKTQIVCLALLPQNRIQYYWKKTYRDLCSLFASQNVLIKKCVNNTVSSVAELPSAYKTLSGQANSISPETGSRYTMLVRLYSLENELYDRLFDVDPSEIRALLEEIRKIVSMTDSEVTLHIRGYYCFLWRSVERAIFQKVGRRKTSIDKLVVDEDLANCHTSSEMCEVVLRYILSYITDLSLNDHTSYHKVVERAKDYIRANYAENLTLEKIAAEAGVSPSYMSKLFKKEETINFKQYLIQVRMEKAKTLLSLGHLNITEVSCACGYADAAYFCRLFKQHFGMSPKEFQRRT